MSWWWLAGLAALCAYICLYLISITFFGRKPGRNPFVLPSVLSGRRRLGPDDVVGDDRVRDAVLKQNFAASRVPEKLDAIVIGSGIGGLSVASLLAKARRRVLVLEQHDVIGGCCHTFVDKGYEFDVGIHYIGEMVKGSMLRTLVDQITDCKLQWEPMYNDAFDVVQVGENVRIEVGDNRQRLIDQLVAKFPKEEAGIKKFFGVINELRRSSTLYWALKLVPLPVALLLAHSGVLKWFSPQCRYAGMSLLSLLDSCVTDKALRTALCYCMGDYGVVPAEASVMMHAILLNHYQRSGAYYPVGGASEIAFHIVPIIEKNGGRALVRANVTGIECNEQGRACAVKLQRDSGEYRLEAPLIVSSIGLPNTVKLLPEPVLSRTSVPDMLRRLQPGVSAMSLFVGLRLPPGKSVEDLQLKRQNLWLYPNDKDDLQQQLHEYASLDLQEAAATDPPFLFTSFPSLKDPTWERRRGADRLTCAIISLANWDWFSQWQDARVKHRGAEYNSLKMAIANRLWNIVKAQYPQLEDLEVELMDMGSPLSNKYYIGAAKGEIYGLHHDIARLEPTMAAKLRPDIGIPGLLLSGQDVACCGFCGALMAGLLCASAALNRNLVKDLVKIIKLERAGAVRTIAPSDADTGADTAVQANGSDAKSE